MQKVNYDVFALIFDFNRKRIQIKYNKLYM